MTLDQIRRLVPKFAQWVAICVCACMVAVTGGAQQPDLTAAASKIARDVETEKVKKLVVFDFVGPDRNITALGVKLADDFSQALSEADHKLKIENRATLPQWAKEEGYGPEDFLDSGSIIPLGLFLRMNAAILGAISLKDGQTTLSIYAFQFTKTGVTRIDRQDIVIPSSDGNSKMIQTYIVRGGATSDAVDLGAVGMRGYSYPRCLQCPAAQYSNAAIHAGVSGTVTLSVVVTTDGRAIDIRVIKGLPEGLTDSAVNAVRNWKFQPATDPGGRPVPIRQIILISFHFG